MKIKERLFIFLLCFLVSLLFFYPIVQGKIPFPGDLLVGNYAPYNANSYDGYLPGSVPHKAQGVDVIRQLFPWKHFSIETLKKGEVPFWNPYNFSGNAHVANFQSGFFYPINLLFFIFDFTTSWSIFILLIPILCAFFTFLFLKELGLSKIASFYGGIVFAFSSYTVVWVEWGNVGHSILWLPLALYATEKSVSKITKKNAILLILSLWLSLLSGYAQGFFYTLVTVCFYYLFKRYNKHLLFSRQTLRFLLLLTLPLLLGLFQLIPAVELFLFSSRGNYSLEQFQKMLNPIWYSITLLVPDFFGNPASRNYWIGGTYIERVSYFGLAPFLFAMYAVLNYKKRLEIKIFLIIFLFSFILATDFFITKFFYLLPIPMISTTVPTRILSLFVFSGSTLSAVGLQMFLEREKKKPVFFVAGSIAFFLLLSWGIAFVIPKILKDEWVFNLSVTKRNLVLPTLYFIAVTAFIFIYFFSARFNGNLRNRIKKTVILGIFIVTLFDLFYFFQKITPFSPKEFVYPTTPVLDFIKKNASYNRFWGYGSAYIDTNFQTYEGIYSTDGYDPLYIRQYGEFLASAKTGTLSTSVQRSDANLPPGYGTNDLKQNNSRQTALNLLGVKYVIHKFNQKTADLDTFPKEKYRLAWQNNDWQVYENRNALPRAFLVPNYVVQKDKKRSIETLFDKSFPISKSIILENTLPDTYRLREDKSATADIQTYSPNKITFKTKSKTDEILFLSDNFYPGWQVTIDEKSGKIYRADYSFRAVPIKSGTHRVIMYYQPTLFQNGLLASFLFLVLALITAQFKRV